MTLDCYIFLYRCFSQSRVISVHSYYLTSLVTSRFYRFGDKTFSSSQAFLRTNHLSFHHILSFVRSHSAGSYQVEKLLSYGSLYCRNFLSAAVCLCSSIYFSMLLRKNFYHHIYIRCVRSIGALRLLPVHWYHPFWL